MKLKFDHEWIGCIHIHSIYSDGTETIPRIAEMGNQLGLDYLVITDHMTLQPLKDGYEGWYDNLAVIIGYEINDSDDTNHYLALGLKDEVDKHLPADKYVKAVKKNGGIGIIAHPDEKRDQFIEHPPYPWTEWDSNDYHGIEIWNHLSEWIEGLTPFNRLYRFIHPRKSIEAPPQETLKKWDELNLKRPVFAVGGVDAHAHRYKILGIFPVRIFHYKVQFKTIRTHVLLDNLPSKEAPFQQTKEQFLSSLKNGRAFISNFLLGDAKGFRFYCDTNRGIVEMGESLPDVDAATLYCHIPEIARIRVIKNGSIYKEMSGKSIEMPVEPNGIYRIEVLKRGKNWIYSNHIRFINTRKGD